MEGASTVLDRPESGEDRTTVNASKILSKSAEDLGQDVRILSVDRVTVEKIVLENGGSREVLLRKSESWKKLSERTSRLGGASKSRSSLWRKRSSSTDELASSAASRIQKLKVINNFDFSLVNDSSKNHSADFSHLPDGKKTTTKNQREKRISPIKLTKSSSIGSLSRLYRPGKVCNVKIRKIPPKVPAKPTKKYHADLTKNSASLTHVEEKRDSHEDAATEASKAHEILEKSQSKIESLQKNLQTQINLATAETYKKNLPGLSSLRTPTIGNLDLNENITKVANFDKDFLERHNYDTKLKIEEKRLLETDIDGLSDTELNEHLSEKPRYSKKVREIEKRWSGEFLENHPEQNSSESSYVEELGSSSSRESIKIVETKIKFKEEKNPSEHEEERENSRKHSSDEIFEETVSTVDSDSCLEDRIKAIDDDVISESVKDNQDVESDAAFQSKSACQLNRNLDSCPADNSRNFDKSASSSGDGYASLIKEFTMEGNSSKGPKEEKKKKSGLRRLLPGIFSPKESRKEYKREQKERKKRDDKHFHQHQQNGIFTRSPDSMNLNEDITRNVKLDTSLNSSIIEERLNEIKQELFPEQGMTTSTPDHFLQNDPTLAQDPRSARSFTVNSSLSSIAPEDKWLDHNIISGSPDMRKFKQTLRNDNEMKCSLERKHSLQESNQPRFLRNHGPSGRISAPPSERFLIRPRAVHPVDRPLPAIPQRVEMANYENHQQIRKYPNYFRRPERIQQLTNYPNNPYGHATGNDNYINDPSLYENGNHVVCVDKTEINRNQSVDSGFNLTPVSAQVKITRQFIVNQNQKAPLVGRRSPKYSPSSSQKSGDYADSSYTPNSSQKSEFSPGSSKSGEYYLNSPRNSCRTSPNDSFNERRDNEQELSQNAPYPVSPKIRVESKAERVYDVAPISPLQEIRVDKPSPSPRQMMANQPGVAQDVPYGTLKASPNIPLSTNLAKLRANVENTRNEASQNTDGEGSINENEARERSRITSPVPSSRALASPLQFRDSPTQCQTRDQQLSSLHNLPRTMSPSRIQRIASPLTVLTPASPSPANVNLNLSPARSMTSPKNILQENNSTQDPHNRRQSNQSRPPTMSANMTQNRGTPPGGSPHSHPSSLNSRRAQPNDQILIASPKREASMYESQSGRHNGTVESGCPDSPVPMAESPSQLMISRSQAFRQNLSERSLSPLSEGLHRASPNVRAMSPAIEPQPTQKNIPRPEPIYLGRHSSQRTLSPMTIQSDSSRGHSPLVCSGDNRSNSLLVQVQPGNIRNQASGVGPNQQDQNIHNAPKQSVGGKAGESIYVERRVQSASSTPRMNSQRPEVIYVQRDQSLIIPNAETKGELDSSSTLANQRSTNQSQQISDSRRIRRASESIYEDGKSGKCRDSPVSEHIYGIRQNQASPASPRSTELPRPRQDSHTVQLNRPTQATLRLPQQHQQQMLDNQQQEIYGQRQSLKQREPIYGQRCSEPIYGQHQNRQLSPSKRQMLQHLEAFYWQQKALDAQRKSSDSPTLINRDETKIESAEVREAIYWQQLKKLDEEQQRKLFENNQIEEKSDPLYCTRKVAGSGSLSPVGNQSRHGSTPSLANQSLSVALSQDNHQQVPEIENQQIYWQNKPNHSKSQIPVGKPPMMGQKGQNQPVLVVRPQQAVRELDRTSHSAGYDEGDGETMRQDGIRSKSASPHFTRGDERRSLSLPRKPVMFNQEPRTNVKLVRGANTTSSTRKSQTPPIYEAQDIEAMDNAKKPLGPPPIFKRGSLISNSSSSVDYGTMGTKRVSFSNQANSPEVGSGNWPTKHGMAPEPPTRKHRTEEKSSLNSETNDSVYLQNHEDNNVYGNISKSPSVQSDDRTCSLLGQTDVLYETEYDAKPLPPPPRGTTWILKRSSSLKDSSLNSARIPRIEIQRAKVPANPRKWPGVSESESGSEAGEVQKILQRRNEEEWNPGGKGRQSNDTGGSGRAEGEGGSNDLVGGRRGGGGSGGVLGGGRGSGTSGSGGGGAGGRSRDEPRRHTLSGDHQPSLHHQQFNTPQLHPLHPHHLPPTHGQYGTPPNRHTTMDLEMGTKSRQRKSPLPRGYPPPSSTMLFDDDPGIMSEVETSSTGFRRGGKQRSSLPVVRTPSKTLERPLGQVFLQYRNETKRALLPNEITSIDTVKALFVRSFPKQLTMEYLDSPHVKVYIHDSTKNMFYELEDLRSHLRDIRDRSVLRLFESTDGVAGMPGPMGVPVGGAGLPAHWEDQSYFSEPEFDSEFQHQHIHKSKTSKNSTSGSNYYMGGSSTLPRGGSLMRAYSPATSSVVAGPNATPTQPKTLGTPDRLHGESGYMSSPERGGGVGSGSGRYPGGPYSTGSSYEEPYYSQYSGTVTPVIDEEARIRVEQMERQLANLTGLVQKALTHAPLTSPSPRDYLQVPAGRDPYTRTTDKSVSFEKSVSFSDEPPDMNSPKQHSPQHAERDRHKPTPPPKPVALAAGQYVYRDLALTPEMYNQLRGLQKKAKDLRQEVRNLRRMSQTQAHTVRESIRDTFITIRAMLISGGEAAWAAGDTEKMRLNREEDLYKQEMIRLEKDLTELESTVEELRGNVINRKTRVNMSDVESMALVLSKSSKTVADLKVRFPSLQEGMKGLLSSEMEKVVREEKFLKEEPERLESALRRCKKLTGTLVTLKRLASVQEQRSPNAASVDAEETPPITPTSAQHSKTTAPVPAERTVVGPAGVIGGGAHAVESSTPNQQRPENALDALLDELQTFSRPTSQLSQASGMMMLGQSTAGNHMPNLSEMGRSASQIVQSSGRAPNISDIGRKGSIDSSTSLAIVTPGHTNTLRRLHSYPSSSDTDTSPPIARLQISDSGAILPPQKPPVPERNAELLQLATSRRVPPPPPPRTSSRSPLASPTSPQLPPRNPTAGTLRRGRNNQKESGKPPMALPPNANSNDETLPPANNNILSASNSSSCESINSQEGLQNKKGRQEQLEQRHQELLRKQKALQEQYARLQQLHRNASGLATVPPAPPDLLKKTGSESNLLAKMGLGLSTTSSGSLTSLASKAEAAPSTGQVPQAQQQPQQHDSTTSQTVSQTTTSKIYETDIL